MYYRVPVRGIYEETKKEKSNVTQGHPRFMHPEAVSRTELQNTLWCKVTFLKGIFWEFIREGLGEQGRKDRWIHNQLNRYSWIEGKKVENCMECAGHNWEEFTVLSLVLWAVTDAASFPLPPSPPSFAFPTLCSLSSLPPLSSFSSFFKFAFFNLVVLYFDSANKHLRIYQWSTLFTHLMVSANILTIENNCAHRVRVSLYDKNSFKIWFLQKGHFLWSWILSTPKSKTLGESLKTLLGLTFIS